jgi:hypothetical protein
MQIIEKKAMGCSGSLRLPVADRKIEHLNATGMKCSTSNARVGDYVFSKSREAVAGSSRTKQNRSSGPR